MSKELVEEIMALEEKAEDELKRAERDREQMVRKAKEKAMLLIQDAEHSLDTQRQNLIAAHDKTLHGQKQQQLDLAQQEARALRTKADKNVKPAVDFVLSEFSEYVHNDIS